MRLTPQEAADYKNAPVVYNGEIGFFFEPDEYGVIKVCDEFPGFTSRSTSLLARRLLSKSPFLGLMQSIRQTPIQMHPR
jgi:hypothetical protein